MITARAEERIYEFIKYHNTQPRPHTIFYLDCHCSKVYILNSLPELCYMATHNFSLHNYDFLDCTVFSILNLI